MPVESLDDAAQELWFDRLAEAQGEIAPDEQERLLSAIVDGSLSDADRVLIQSAAERLTSPPAEPSETLARQVGPHGDAARYTGAKKGSLSAEEQRRYYLLLGLLLEPLTHLKIDSIREDKRLGRNDRTRLIVAQNVITGRPNHEIYIPRQETLEAMTQAAQVLAKLGIISHPLVTSIFGESDVAASTGQGSTRLTMSKKQAVEILLSEIQRMDTAEKPSGGPMRETDILFRIEALCALAFAFRELGETEQAELLFARAETEMQTVTEANERRALEDTLDTCRKGFWIEARFVVLHSSGFNEQFIREGTELVLRSDLEGAVASVRTVNWRYHADRARGLARVVMIAHKMGLICEDQPGEALRPARAFTSVLAMSPDELDVSLRAAFLNKGYEVEKIVFRRIEQTKLCVVYKAQEKSTGRTVAIRWVYDPEFKKQEGFKLIRDLSDDPFFPAELVKVYTIDRLGEGSFAAMEWIEGKTAEEFLVTAPTFTVETLFRFLRANLVSESYLNSRSITHAETALQNTLVGGNGVRIADYGFSRRIRGPGDFKATLHRIATMVIEYFFYGPSADRYFGERLTASHADLTVEEIEAMLETSPLFAGLRPDQQSGLAGFVQGLMNPDGFLDAIDALTALEDLESEFFESSPDIRFEAGQWPEFITPATLQEAVTPGKGPLTLVRAPNVRSFGQRKLESDPWQFRHRIGFFVRDKMGPEPAENKQGRVMVFLESDPTQPDKWIAHIRMKLPDGLQGYGRELLAPLVSYLADTKAITRVTVTDYFSRKLFLRWMEGFTLSEEDISELKRLNEQWQIGLPPESLTQGLTPASLSHLGRTGTMRPKLMGAARAALKPSVLTDRHLEPLTHNPGLILFLLLPRFQGSLDLTDVERVKSFLESTGALLPRPPPGVLAPHFKAVTECESILKKHSGEIIREYRSGATIVIVGIPSGRLAFYANDSQASGALKALQNASPSDRFSKFGLTLEPGPETETEILLIARPFTKKSPSPVGVEIARLPKLAEGDRRAFSQFGLTPADLLFLTSGISPDEQNEFLIQLARLSRLAVGQNLDKESLVVLVKTVDNGQTILHLKAVCLLCEIGALTDYLQKLGRPPRGDLDKACEAIRTRARIIKQRITASLEQGATPRPQDLTFISTCLASAGDEKTTSLLLGNELYVELRVLRDRLGTRAVIPAPSAEVGRGSSTGQPEQGLGQQIDETTGNGSRLQEVTRGRDDIGAGMTGLIAEVTLADSLGENPPPADIFGRHIGEAVSAYRAGATMAILFMRSRRIYFIDPENLSEREANAIRSANRGAHPVYFLLNYEEKNPERLDVRFTISQKFPGERKPERVLELELPLMSTQTRETLQTAGLNGLDLFLILGAQWKHSHMTVHLRALVSLLQAGFLATESNRDILLRTSRLVEARQVTFWLTLLELAHRLGVTNEFMGATEESLSEQRVKQGAQFLHARVLGLKELSPHKDTLKVAVRAAYDPHIGTELLATEDRTALLGMWVENPAAAMIIDAAMSRSALYEIARAIDPFYEAEGWTDLKALVETALGDLSLVAAPKDQFLEAVRLVPQWRQQNEINRTRGGLEKKGFTEKQLDRVLDDIPEVAQRLKFATALMELAGTDFLTVLGPANHESAQRRFTKMFDSMSPEDRIKSARLLTALCLGGVAPEAIADIARSHRRNVAGDLASLLLLKAEELLEDARRGPEVAGLDRTAGLHGAVASAARRMIPVVRDPKILGTLLDAGLVALGFSGEAKELAQNLLFRIFQNPDQQAPQLAILRTAREKGVLADVLAQASAFAHHAIRSVYFSDELTRDLPDPEKIEVYRSLLRLLAPCGQLNLQMAKESDSGDLEVITEAARLEKVAFEKSEPSGLMHTYTFVPFIGGGSGNGATALTTGLEFFFDGNLALDVNNQPDSPEMPVPAREKRARLKLVGGASESRAPVHLVSSSDADADEPLSTPKTGKSPNTPHRPNSGLPLTSVRTNVLPFRNPVLAR